MPVNVRPVKKGVCKLLSVNCHLFSAFFLFLFFIFFILNIFLCTKITIGVLQRKPNIFALKIVFVSCVLWSMKSGWKDTLSSDEKKLMGTPSQSSDIEQGALTPTECKLLTYWWRLLENLRTFVWKSAKFLRFLCTVKFMVHTA